MVSTFLLAVGSQQTFIWKIPPRVIFKQDGICLVWWHILSTGSNALQKAYPWQHPPRPAAVYNWSLCKHQKKNVKMYSRKVLLVVLILAEEGSPFLWLFTFRKISDGSIRVYWPDSIREAVVQHLYKWQARALPLTSLHSRETDET